MSSGRGASAGSGTATAAAAAASHNDKKTDKKSSLSVSSLPPVTYTSSMNKYMAAAMGQHKAMSMKPAFQYPEPEGSRRCCIEDVTLASREPARDPYLTACTLYVKEHSSKDQSWRAQFELGKPAAGYAFPQSTIQWARRLRTKEITFRVAGDAKTKITELFSTITAAQLRAVLLECTEKECEHAIVPIRMRLSDQVCENIATPFKIQIGTAPFFMTLDHMPSRTTKRDSVQHWFDEDGTGVDVTHLAATATPTATASAATSTKLRPLENEDDGDVLTSVTPRRAVIQQATSGATASLVKSSVVFAAGVEYANANNYDLLRALSARRNDGFGWNYYLIRNAYLSPSDVLVRQADSANRCHDVVSYVVQNDVFGFEKGFNATKLGQMTHWQDSDANLPVSQRKSYWKVNLKDLKQQMQTRLDRIAAFRLVMDISDGMTATFLPVDPALYRPKDKFMISFTIVMDYIVIDL